MIWNRAAVLAFLLAIVVGAILLIRGCRDEPTETEQRVDSTLATEPAWRDTVRARDSVIAADKREAARLRQLSATQRARADKAEAKADSLQQWADDLAEVPTNLPLAEQNTRLRVALAAQQQATVQFRVVVDSLKAQRLTDSLRLSDADKTILEQQTWLAQSEVRIARLTKDLSDLREETKHKGDWNVLGLHVPGYVKDALFIAAGAKIGYEIGQGT